MIVTETTLTETIAERLIALSKEWEQENSCFGYRKNELSDLENKRIFLAMEGDVLCGYLFGHYEIADKDTSIYKKDQKYFEIDEIYVTPQYRSRGIGKMLFRYVEQTVSSVVRLLLLATATKNFRAILHFYIDELDMEFWNAVLFKNIDVGG